MSKMNEGFEPNNWINKNNLDVWKRNYIQPFTCDLITVETQLSYIFNNDENLVKFSSCPILIANELIDVSLPNNLSSSSIARQVGLFGNPWLPSL